MKKHYILSFLFLFLLVTTCNKSLFALTTFPPTGIGRTSASLHARLDDDLGKPCECRFRISGSFETLYTTWEGPYEANDVFHAWIGGLTPGTLYTVQAQARWIEDHSVFGEGNAQDFVTLPPLPPPQNDPPNAVFTYSPEKPRIGENIIFDASDSDDPDGTIISYEWDFGDGNTVTKLTPKSTYIYKNPDTYNVTLTVKDNLNEPDTTSQQIEVLRERWLHVLCVGVDHRKYGTDQLDGKTNAAAIYEILKRFPNWVETNPPPLILDPYTSGNVNRKSLIDDLNDIKSKLQKGDNFIFYFNGHGGFPMSPGGDETPIVISAGSFWSVPIINTQDEYLDLQDGPFSNDFSDNDLTDCLNDPKWDFVNKLILIDACHSGGFWGDEYNVTDSGDLEELPRSALLASSPEWGASSFYLDTGRSIWTISLESAIKSAASPRDIAKYISYWVRNKYFKQLLPIQKDDFFPPTDTYVVFEPSFWEPVFYATEDFDMSFPESTFWEHTLLIKNFVKHFQTDPNGPHVNHGILTYTEEEGNLNGIDVNDVYYVGPAIISSKIVSLIPVKNLEGDIIDFNELSTDARPYPMDVNDPNSTVLIELSIHNSGPNDVNIHSENYLQFWLANNAFKGKPLTIQQISDDENTEYPVWDIINIINTNDRKLPLHYLISNDVDPSEIQFPNTPVKIIEPNVPYASLILSTEREIADIDENGAIDLDDYTLLLEDFGKEGILRSDIASSKNSISILGIPDGEVNESDEDAFITEYNKKHPDNMLPNPYGFTERFESGQIQQPFVTSEDSPWIISTDAYEGNYCVKSRNIGNDQSSTLEATVNCSYGYISFFRKVSSEENFDFLIFFIDDVEIDRWSGEEDWDEVSYTTTPGIHTLTWKYVKDLSMSSDSDCAWLDCITLVPEQENNDLIIGDFENEITNWSSTWENSVDLAFSTNPITVTSGMRSLKIRLHPSAYWTLQWNAPTVPNLQPGTMLQFDVTMIQSEWTPSIWTNVGKVALTSDSANGWKEYTPSAVDRITGQRTSLDWGAWNPDALKTYSVDISDYDITNATWFQINISIQQNPNNGAGYFYIDNVRLINQ